jgi:hypothetical protein
MMNLLLHAIEGGVDLADTLSPDGERLNQVFCWEYVLLRNLRDATTTQSNANRVLKPGKWPATIRQ